MGIRFYPLGKQKRISSSSRAAYDLRRCREPRREPRIGHTRVDLTDQPLKFWAVFSYLGVYDDESRPLRIVAVLHGVRDVEQFLKNK